MSKFREMPTLEVETIQEKAQGVPDKQAEVYFEQTKWHGVIPTFRCVACGHCDESRDSMVLHVVEKHVTGKNKERVLNQLIKER
jgi:Zn ribbon nucleic-acid-binding protein